MKGSFTTTMEKGTAFEVPVLAQPGHKKKSAPTIFRIVAVVIAVVVLMSLTASIAAYISNASCDKEENNKPGRVDHNYHMTFHTSIGEVQEDMYMSQREVIYYQPDVIAMYDFHTSLTIYRLLNPDWDLEDCYVTSFNLSTEVSPQVFIDEHQSTKVELTITNTKEMHFAVSDISVNSDILGPKAKEICAGRKVFFLRTLDDANIMKRAARCTCSTCTCRRIIIIVIVR